MTVKDAQYGQLQQAHKAQKAVQDVGIYGYGGVHSNAPWQCSLLRRYVVQQLRRQGQGVLSAGDGAGGFRFAEAFQQAANLRAGG